MTDIAAREKRAPLAQIWRFVCVEKQLTKTDVLDTDIQIEITRMIHSVAAPVGLRANSQLLLGVVRLYKQKVRYLLEDCDRIVIQIRLMHQRHVQLGSTPAMQRRSSSVIGCPEMSIVSGAQSSPDCVSNSRRVTGDVIMDSDILMADLESNIQAYIDDHNCKGPKRTFTEMIQTDRMKATQPAHNYDSDFGDIDLDLDLGESPLSVASPVVCSLSCGSAGSLSPTSLYQHTETPTEIGHEPVNIAMPGLRKNRKRQRVLEDQDTVISLADLKKQQLDRSATLRPHAPSSAALPIPQRTLASDFALSLFQGPRHCAPELKQYLSIDFVRAHNAVILDDAVETTDLQPREADDYGDDLASNQSDDDYTPFEAWSDEEIQPFRNRLVSAASSETRLFQQVVSGLTTQDVSACFLELLVLATQGAISIEQKSSFGDIWIDERFTEQIRGRSL
ncbi:MAG: hypothetical protein Q9210_000589 [Variospora velana]